MFFILPKSSRDFEVQFTLRRLGVLILPILALLSSQAFAATITVNNLNDSGSGSLRQAILDANSTTASDVINFSVSGTITIQSLLPRINRPVAINGYSSSADQGPIGSRNIRVTVNGGNLTNYFSTNNGGRASGDGLFRFGSGASGSSISGLSIINTGSGVEAVQIEPGCSNIHVWGNYIGVSASGLASTSTRLRDDAVFLGSYDDLSPAAISNISIGTNGDNINDANEGNVLSNAATAEAGDGVEIGYPTARLTLTDIRISGNYIGMAADGVTVAPNGTNSGSDPNGFDGVLVTSINGTNVIIGSDGNGVSDAYESNLISGNTGNGIEILSSNGIAVAGNLIGTDKNGTSSKPNALKSSSTSYYSGISISIETDGNLTKLPCHDIIIGFDDNKHNTATAAAVRNIISGNQSVGIDMFGLAASSQRNNTIKIAGNYVGVDISGNTRLGNGAGASPSTFSGNGIEIEDATSITVGTDGDGVFDDLEKNVASGAIFGRGITMYADLSTIDNCIIAGNLIGVGANGSTAIGNDSPGIVIGTATNIRIGSNDDGTSDALESNIIANNAHVYPGSSDGVRVTGASTGIRISRNSFYNNMGTPIDLADNGITLNDGSVTNGQPNLLLDYPVITSYSLSGSTINVAGYVSTCNGSETTAGPSIAGTKTIQFYKVADDGDQNGALTNGSCTRSVNHGEGVQYLGSISAVNTFNTSFNLVAGATFTSSDKITAIAIDANGNTSEFGVTAADITVVGPPDLTPTFRVTPSSVVGDGTTVACRIFVAEINAAPTNSTPIYLLVPKSSHYTLNTYNPSQTSSGGLPVQNSQWTYTSENASNYIFKYIGTAPLNNSGSSFGISIVYNANGTSGSENIVISIFDGSGGETNFLNNKDGETINFNSGL